MSRFPSAERDLLAKGMKGVREVRELLAAKPEVEKTVAPEPVTKARRTPLEKRYLIIVKKFQKANAWSAYLTPPD